ncbi:PLASMODESMATA CALLOSE-BINDING PROTEIN 2 [Lolium perenne]|uniref:PLASMODESMATA CALLOSE-BINDING PROTEIN 2 n=1 Tax=Lolium perenne TaxID=4522 RepID=UPI0021EA2F01|nr:PLASMODESMATA CALLOSE-BINDING PROTEIN 3-like [Lolium perenne]
MMASPAFLLLLLAASIRGSAAAWCVCRADANETALQETLDYACGQGADCTPVATGGSCHSPDSVVAHCSYAANSYYQRSSQTKGATCDFGGTATLTTTDPSTGTCKYPASASSAGTSTGNGTAPGAGAGVGTNPSSPGGATNPATPGMGGTFTTPIGGASGPSASIIGPESSDTPAATAASIGLRVLLGVASVLAFFVQ